MARTKIAPKAGRTKGPGTLADPDYIGLRMKGLARLIEHAATGGPDVNPINIDAAFFISTELEAMAVALGAR